MLNECKLRLFPHDPVFMSFFFSFIILSPTRKCANMPSDLTSIPSLTLRPCPPAVSLHTPTGSHLTLPSSLHPGRHSRREQRPFSFQKVQLPLQVYDEIHTWFENNIKMISMPRWKIQTKSQILYPINHELSLFIGVGTSRLAALMRPQAIALVRGQTNSSTLEALTLGQVFLNLS